MSLKDACEYRPEENCYVLTRGVRVPVRIFMTPVLFAECEEEVFRQTLNAASFPGVEEVVLTPDAHSGYVVPVGCVMSTRGTLCQAPVGYDIGCGMAVLTSTVPAEKGLDDGLRRRFSREVMEHVGMGTGVGSGYTVDERRFEEIVRGGARALGYTRDNSERDYLPVDDRWEIPARPKQRGLGQLGSLGGGNHFIELQYDQHRRLVVMVHTGSRGFGHGLASHYIELGRSRLRQRARGSAPAEPPEAAAVQDRRAERRARRAAAKSGTITVEDAMERALRSAEAVYFEPDDPHWWGYRNAVAAGANFAIANRLIIMEQVSRAFHRVFGEEPEMLYEISHNLVQEEPRVSGEGTVWVHRKGATRALPAGHPLLAGTRWAETGHPILIPGSMGDTSYILYARPGAARSLYSVNHGCGRRLSRSAARSLFSQQSVNEEMRARNVLVNAGGDVPVDESPGCYKPASLVIEAVVSAGLAEVACVLTPIASLKGTD